MLTWIVTVQKSTDVADRKPSPSATPNNLIIINKKLYLTKKKVVLAKSVF
jgi:hypothetical protein